jgi:hypothetical protein
MDRPSLRATPPAISPIRWKAQRWRMMLKTRMHLGAPIMRLDKIPKTINVRTSVFYRRLRLMGAKGPIEPDREMRQMYQQYRDEIE